MKVRQGQELVLIISGYNLNPEEWPEIPPLPTVNKGNVTIHTGGGISFLYYGAVWNGKYRIWNSWNRK